MHRSWSNLVTQESWPEENDIEASFESYKLAVAGISAEVVFWSGKSMLTSFYLRLASSQGMRRETLGERLNDPETRFLACKTGDRTELLNPDWLSHLRVFGPLAEVGQQEEVGAKRQPAWLTLQSGCVLRGEFLSVQSVERSRLSDLLNASGDRFLLFLMPAAAMYVNRSAIVRVVPGKE
jgi:hypothetical protein